MYIFVLFFCVFLLHRLAVRIKLPFHNFRLHFKPYPHAVRIFFNGNTVAPLQCMCSFMPVHTLRRSQRSSKICHSESDFENLNLLPRNFPKKVGGVGKALGTSS